MEEAVVDDKTIKTWLDIAPAYLTFFIRFLQSPPKAFKNMKGSSEISSDLVHIMAGGVALSYVVILALASPDLASDTGRVATFVRKVDRNALPVVVLLLTVAASVVVHVVGKIGARIFERDVSEFKAMPRLYLGGTVEDSVNAALGFAAVFIPMGAAVIALLSRTTKLSMAFSIVGVLVLLILLLGYLPWALSATHPNTRFRDAFIAFCFAYSGTGLVVIALG